MTDLDLRAGQIHRGLGVVARWPDIALVIPSDSAHDKAVDEMFRTLGPAPTSPKIVSAIDELLEAGNLHAVGMLVEATGGPLAMAYGPIEILVDGDPTLNGSSGGVRQQLPASAHRLTVRAANLSKAAEPVAPYDIRRGTAPGAGLTLITIPGAAPPAPTGLRPATTLTPPTKLQGHQMANIDEPTLSPEQLPEKQPGADPIFAIDDSAVGDRAVGDRAADDLVADGHGVESPAGVRSGRFSEGDIDGQPAQGPQVERVTPATDLPRTEVPFRSVLLVGSQSVAAMSPLPVADAPKTGQLSRTELDAGRVEVQGILCSRQHFNNPGSSNCMVCGLSMLHLTLNLVKGPRPTLGFIVFDDGNTFGLDRSYVIGREPVAAEGSNAEVLVLHDNNETLSRTHAELKLDDWTVQLMDLNSTNGTYVWDQTFERWNQLAPGHAVELKSGDTIALGRRTFVFESVSRS